ncbi:hypothetical protein AB0D42_25540 [Streptomyces sp. NPDC048304]|uniref:hypothetical protein n=1 Tax=Streptomyces sp. NPDC048304 TaxID=3154820 RepID=UPI0033D06F03
MPALPRRGRGRPLKLFLDLRGMRRPSGTADGQGAGCASPQVRPFESADEAAVLDLLVGDRLPGRLACSTVTLAEAVA